MPTVEMAVFAQIRKYSPTVCPVNSRSRREQLAPRRAAWTQISTPNEAIYAEIIRAKQTDLQKKSSFL